MITVTNNKKRNAWLHYFYHRVVQVVARRAWLSNHEVPFEEHNIMTSPLSAPELKHILSLTENGTDDIISTRSKIFQKLNLDVESLSISELLRLIEENQAFCVVQLF